MDDIDEGGGMMPVAPQGLPPPAWQFAPPIAAGGGGGGGNGRGGQPIPTHPGGLDEGATYFTYESPKERKYFEKATEGLDIKYDGSAKGLLMFVTDVEQKANMFGWKKILSIPTAAGLFSLLTHYGQITIADIHIHAYTYMNEHTRDHQDSNHLKLFLHASLEKTFMMRVLAHKSQYIVNGVQHGPAMFRVILSLVGIQSKATVAVINAALRRLPTKMDEYGSNIEKFNEYVVNQCTELTSRGKTPQDLVSLLFEAYDTAGHEEFRMYMRQKWQNVLDGTTPELSSYEVMYAAEEYYKHRVTTGEWKEKVKKEMTPLVENGVFLRAEFEAYKAEISEKFKKRTAARNNDKKFAWKDIEPKGGEQHYKTVGNKDYVFCPNHESTKWVLADKHKDGCTKDPGWSFPMKGLAKYKARIDTGGTVPPKLTPVKSNIQPYVKALMSVMDVDDQIDWESAYTEAEMNDENI
jgi:hypothetical protein